jgi:glycosyltransferase involved in cell wall biosynthesis
MGKEANHYEIDVSVLIPVYNEEKSLPELREELWPVLESLGQSFEVVFVDDGSTDQSPHILRRFAEEDPRVRVIRFARNFGQQMANTAGLRHTRGRAVIIMDADLQTPARHIPELLAKLREGYDIVYGKRQAIRGPLYRRIGTRIANFLICKITGFEIPDSASGFLALDDRLVQRVNRYDDRSRYLSGLFAWLSYGRSAWVPVTRRERLHGKSHYKVLQLVRIVLNLITTWSSRPLQFVTWTGFGFAGVAALLFLRWLYGLFTAGWTAAEPVLFVTILVTLGCALLFGMGILGEYVGRIYSEVRQHPPYVIADIIEAEPAVQEARRE